MNWDKLIETSPYWGPFLVALFLILQHEWRVIKLLGNDLTHSVDGLKASVDTLNGNIQRLLGRGDKL